MEIIGNRYGRLVVVSESDRKRLPSGQTNRVFNCICDCGNTKSVRMLHLVRNRILSCGCIVKTRGGRGNTPIGKLWRAIKYRCDEKYFENHLYFKKGIKVCDEWLNDYFKFEEWAIKNGHKKGLQIDRIDNSKGYYPDNCRFVTPEINTNNRDNTIMVYYDGINQSLQLLLKRLNKKNDYYTITSRIRRGWSVERAINTPIKIGNYKRNDNIRNQRAD